MTRLLVSGASAPNSEELRHQLNACRFGDISPRNLPDVVSKAVGCENVAMTGWKQCRLVPLPDSIRKIEWSPEGLFSG